jgi:type III restriction enzyme
MAGKKKAVVKKMNLSEHTLDINIRRCNYNKFNFSAIEEYVRQLTGTREYQYQAVKQVMIYLWGGSYNTIVGLAEENYAKPRIQQRFGSKQMLINHLPLPDRLSGVVHMATGTGKSYVIFAVAYLSLVMGLTRRVLVLGPASTIIEQGLREKFKDLMTKKKFIDKLPPRYRGKAINILNDNDTIEDDSIIIENINAVYTFGAITDTLFKNTDEVLVLGDEIHHAYSHLKETTDNRLVMDQEETAEGRRSDEKEERLWMQFLRGNKQITRHIGFTGTPYNQDEYFADIIFNYSIKDAIEQKYIKDINNNVRTRTDEGDTPLTIDQRFEIVLKNHLDNREKYAYRDSKGKRRVKPVTIFICPTQKNAQDRSEAFIKFLGDYEKKHNGATGTDSEIADRMRKKVICVVSRISQSEYKDQLDHIEEIDPKKTGGAVEYVFAVNKLSEGWDVDNVFQIVPMEERVFKSKLLISQVLGRGLRIPRNIPNAHIHQTYPYLTVTNHDRFADHIKEMVDSVTQSDMYLSSRPLADAALDRVGHHFCLFNLNYIATTRTVDAEKKKTTPPGALILTPFDETLGVTITRAKDEKRYQLDRNFYTVDEVVFDIKNRFNLRPFESLHFDFGEVMVADRYPTEEAIKTVIQKAMEAVAITGNRLSLDNKKQIDIYFNQFLPPGSKKRVFENIEGDLTPRPTRDMDKHSLRLSELDKDATAFLSEDYEKELSDDNKTVLDFLREWRGTQKEKKQLLLPMFEADPFVTAHSEIIRSLVENDARSPYAVNTSRLKNPQSIILVSHNPEREFVFQLIDHADYIDAWIKSPDKGFYSINYEFWRGGKDRTRRGFNPDFFIKIDLDNYLAKLAAEGQAAHLEALKNLQDEGVEYLIRVVEIKSDDDDDEATPGKAEYAGAHFEKLNQKLRTVNIADIPKKYRPDARQHYTFDLLSPALYDQWFSSLRKGRL